MIAWKVYVIRNAENNKGYVGITTKPLSYRLNEHFESAIDPRTREDGTPFPLSGAIGKYGQNRFNIRLLEKGLTLDKAQLRETHWISELRTHATVHRTGYNLTWGGEDPDFDPAQYTKLHEFEFVEGDYCPNCDTGALSRRYGQYGAFLSCENRSECGFTLKVTQSDTVIPHTGHNLSWSGDDPDINPAQKTVPRKLKFVDGDNCPTCEIGCLERKFNTRIGSLLICDNAAKCGFVHKI